MRGFYRLPQRRRRTRHRGYIEHWPDKLLCYEVHAWDGALINCWRTWAEALAALERL